MRSSLPGGCHYFRFDNGKIAFYRGTEDTSQPVAALTPSGVARRRGQRGAAKRDGSSPSVEWTLVAHSASTQQASPTLSFLDFVC